MILPKNTGGTWNVFQDEPVLTTSVFPDDLDTTSLAMRSADGISKETRHAVMDEMLQYMGEDGLFNVSACQ